MVDITPKGQLEFESNSVARQAQNTARAFVDSHIVLRSGLPRPCAPGSALDEHSAQEAQAIAERFTHSANQIMEILNSGEDLSTQQSALRAAAASARPSAMGRGSSDN